MDNLVHALENRLMQNRVLGIFGSYSWSGGGVKALAEFGEKGKWKLVSPIIEVQYAPKTEDIEQCTLLAKNVAKEVKREF